MGKRSGSEKRQRTRPYSIRFTEAERARAEALCDKTGFSLSALIRHALFNTPPPRAARRPTINEKLASRILAELGKIGSNVNQLARQANTGNYPTETIDEAMLTLMEMRSACMEALGREKYRDSKADEED